MKRRFIAGERIMHVDAATPVNCVFAAKIRGSFAEEQLHTALGKLQQKHPLLGVKITEDATGHPWFVSDESVPAIPVRVLERQGDRDWEAISQQEWEVPFGLEQGPLMRVILLKSAEVCDLILVCPHSICDGTSLVSLMRDTLAGMDCPARELAESPVFGSIADLTPTQHIFGWKEKAKFRVYSHLARVYFLLRKKPVLPALGRPYLLHTKLPAALTSSITTKCKLENTTVHAALCLAYLKAFRQVLGTKAKGEVYCPVDSRRLIPALREDTLFAFATGVGLSLGKEGSGGFWQEAREFKGELTGKIEAIEIYRLLQLGEYFHASVPDFIDVLKSKEGTHDITVSNVGRLAIPHGYTSFEVETLYSPTVSFPFKSRIALVASWFRGELDFCFMAYEVYLSKADARAITQRALELLESETAMVGQNRSIEA